ncbi:MAG: type VI secretion system baseplate subunit TssE [Desulfobulbaceae bacterium]|nr:type VI secretion system baseplate subunit TssE [Desulfobulbaceae bacterium]
MLEQDGRVQASILDRLLDDEPGNSQESVRSHAVDFRQIMASVRRDLENLLNTRRFILTPPPSFKEVGNSLLVYGLPDFSSRNPTQVSVMDQLRLEITETIARFEPRLKNVNVMASSSGSRRDLRFRISAVLVVDPISEHVVFDTSFDLNRGSYSISK